ncbi:MAG: PEP-CTERM sorting domain-containing protein [Myxococcota bacterium]
MLIFVRPLPIFSDYRYLDASYLSGVVLDEFIDYSASVSGTLGYVVHRGSAAVPEPSAAWLLALGLTGLGMRRRVH